MIARPCGPRCCNIGLVTKVAAMLALLSGCSFFFIGSPPRPPCKGSAVLPIVDVAISATSLAQTLNCHSEACAFDGLLTVPFTILNGASAVYGIIAGAICRNDVAELATKQRFLEEQAAALEEQRAARAAAQRRIDEETAARSAARERAWTVMQAASSAARSGDCPTVTTLDARVREIDVDFHDSVFVRDAAIARCLQPGP